MSVLDTILENLNKAGTKKRVLLSPLDWGLGHTTRCIPLIKKMTDCGHEVVVALSEPHTTLIREAFPHIEIIELAGYGVKYPKNPSHFTLKILSQLPALIIKRFREKRWIKKLLKEREFDLLISDNRYAFFHPRVRSIIITHQIDIKTGSVFIDKIVERISRKLVNQFDECWVPDFQGDENLAGDLSHPRIKPATPLKYIGPLSRFVSGEEKIIYDLAILLSGPEPQRTIFENLIISQLKLVEHRILLVRGIPNGQIKLNHAQEKVEIHDHLSAPELNRKLLQSKHVLCRSGYSTLMDLFTLGKSATIVPTPGQAEQAYLAEYLDGKHGFRKQEQDRINLKLILDSSQ